MIDAGNECVSEFFTLIKFQSISQSISQSNFIVKTTNKPVALD